ncbi:helix-turn-helix domain-containing protein [Streptomyces sp. NPDC047315]|uniref:PucR family transcriptional regulator n=1 Tax=Streptomyces sp. NPDC047315 TaxID=3155142 RepID=UPI0033D40D26
MGDSDAIRAITERCERRVNEITRRITVAELAAVPGLRELPGDARDTELAASVRHGLRLFLRLARGDDAPGARGIDHFRERAAVHAEEGIALSAVLQGHLVCSRALWSALQECALPDESTALLRLADQLLAAQARVLGEVADTYAATRAALESERQEELRALARALLAGTLPTERRCELGVTDGGLVIALHLGRLGSAVAAQRRLRRLRTDVERLTGTRPLIHFEDPRGGQGYVVLPHGPDGDDGSPRELAARLDRGLGEPTHLAWAEAAGSEGIATAARTAVEVLRVVRSLDRPPGAYALDDVLLEYHLSRPGESGRALAGVLDPVGGHPQLMETLRAYLDEGQDRRATAERLALHPNTVDNRIARVRALTGVDASTPRGFARLLAALVARDLRSEPPPSAPS